MNYSKWVLGTASLAMLFLVGCVKFERDCGGQNMDVESCPDLSTFTGTGSGNDTATLERPLALATAFGGNGTRMVDFGGKEDKPMAMLKQASGKLVVVGHSNFIATGGTVAKKAISMVRIDPTTGAPDLTFAIPTGGAASDGKLIIHDPAGEVEAAGGLIHPSGQLVAGYTLVKSSTDKDFAIGVVTAEGQPNSAPQAFPFPANFAANPATTRTETLKGIGIDSKSRIVLMGKTNANTAGGTETRIGLVRLKANSFDVDVFENSTSPGFANDTIDGARQDSRRPASYTDTPALRSGYTVLNVLGEPGVQEPGAMLIDSSDRIVVVGKARTATSTAASHFNSFITRLDANGLIDSSFATAPHDFGLALEDGANAVVAQSDGKLVVGGFAQGPSKKEFAIFRVAATGLIDSTFGASGSTPGYVRLNFGTNAEINSLQMQGSKILALGWAEASLTNTNKQMVAARFNSDGTLDTTFGTNGTMRFNNSPVTPGVQAAAQGTAALWSGSAMYLAGQGWNGSLNVEDMMLIKLE